MALRLSHKLDEISTVILAAFSSFLGFIFTLIWVGAFEGTIGDSINLYWWSLALQDNGGSNLLRIFGTSYLFLVLTHLLTKRLARIRGKPSDQSLLFWLFFTVSFMFVFVVAAFSITPPEGWEGPCIMLSVISYLLSVAVCWFRLEQQT